MYLRPDDPDVSLLEASDDIIVIARYICEISTVLCVLSYVVLQQGDEIRNQGFWTFLKQQVSGRTIPLKKYRTKLCAKL